MTRRSNFDELRAFADWFPKSRWPRLTCTKCKEGELVEQNITLVETARSKFERNHDHDWGPESTFGYFYGELRCSHSACSEIAVVSGEMTVALTEVPHGRDEYEDYLLPRNIMPALLPIDFPTSCPQEVVAHIVQASAILLQDPSAAGNRIRIAVEKLLTAQKIRRFAPNRKSRLSTHRRIALFRAKNGDAANFLEAVKWIGNDGSHEATLTVGDVLGGLELLQHALFLIYDTKTKRLARLAHKINLNKGVNRPVKRSPKVPF